ncbi:MAG: exonuclease SbcCD subunit D [Nitrospinaceae bacterium]
MASFRFIHCSDLHIDSPFTGLASVRPELAASLRSSTFKAFQNAVRLAVSERVDAVIIAGDIYDSADKSLQAQLKFKRGLEKLSEAGIPTFIVHGNHDPLDGWSATLKMPEGVTVFPGGQVEHHTVTRNGTVLARIYGISYPRRQVKDNLALKFEPQGDEGFSIGVLHANVGSDPNHDDYAPCTLDDLVSRKMDYWALGHIHAHKVLRESHPAVVYPGNTQARHMRETGPRGCCLVTLHDNAPPEIRFVAIDALRYISHALSLAKAETLDHVLAAIRSQCESLAQQAGGRETLIRLTLTGRTPVHKELQRPGNLEDLMEDIHEHFKGKDPPLWVELLLETQGTYDIESLRRGNDFIAEILSLHEEGKTGKFADNWKAALASLYETWPGGKYLEPPNQEELGHLLTEARNLILDRLADPG